jgi:predicted double-glycine peptidase
MVTVMEMSLRTVRSVFWRVMVAGLYCAFSIGCLVVQGGVRAHAETTAAESQSRHRTVTSLKEIRHRNVVVQEWDLSCGAAALATLLIYQQGKIVTEKEVAIGLLGQTNALKVRQRLGFSLLDMKRYLQSLGYKGIGYSKMTVKDLVDMAPAIVPIRLKEGFSHFVVFRGIVGDRVVLADPGFGNRTMRIDRFVTAWDLDIAFVIQRTDGREAPNRLGVGPDDYLVPSRAALREMAFR